MRREIEQLLEVAAARVMLTKQDLALRYSVTERTIERWNALGFLPAPDFEFRRTLRWSALKIFRWEQGRKNAKKRSSTI
ncbi:hypothetical protein NXS98_14275 [Fontisphaera persica]|uniref:hypothetical protein n=1 Tax=Fontisphaera persica TaxID=2974023 RepID=UPI0024C01DB3|nr:hypothetical protein [Fontisphaera persica]WCJ58875.1 hypothetical protein NXS98_14275 [Fontisphaera persica]